MGSKQSKDGTHFRIRAQKSQKIIFEHVDFQWAQINLSGLNCSLIDGSKKNPHPFFFVIFVQLNDTSKKQQDCQ
jgi:hypothetical protein